ncbi:uncharacterized protein LOC114420350 [Glycine soja]|uniref:uncharacterized protein LOC114420350 n=1 Tax=Glycine soja TaxID=3848 RepID=UPI00104042BA|nr:uncharacterized protein LOC114420350 [Glycine soja]
MGSENNRDSDEAPQQRRPTTSACWQREAAPIAEDAHHVDEHDEHPGDPVPIVEEDLECPKLKLSSNGRKIQKFERPVVEIEGLVVATKLSSLVTCSLDTDDRGLISTFTEMLHKETSSFHLPVREVTITLDDVVSLLHLPITGTFHSFETVHVDEAVLLLVELLEVNADEAKVETCWIYEHFPSVDEAITTEDYHRRLAKQ